MKKLTLLSFLVIFCFSVKAQFSYEKPKKSTTDNTSSKTMPKKENEKNQSTGFDKDKLVFGLDLGLGFIGGTQATIGPQLGYKINKKYSVGTGVTYVHRNDKYKFEGQKWTERSNYIGAHIFGRYQPNYFLLFQLQPELGNVWITDTPEDRAMSSAKSSHVVPAVVFGTGLHLGSVALMINYDLVQSKYSPYGDGVFFTLGVMFNL